MKVLFKSILLKVSLFSVFLISCTNDINQNNEKADLKANQIQVESVENLEKNIGMINNQVSKFDIASQLNNFSNHNITYDEVLNKHFININAETTSGENIALRQEVLLSSDEKIITFPKDGRGETCAGVNCSHCVIKSGGGCDCTQAGDPDKTSYCNHTVTIPDPK